MSNYYVLFDTETGGLNTSEDLLTAYFAIVDENLSIIDELDLKLKPNNDRLPIAEAGALKVNGINLQEHLANPETITYDVGHVRLKFFIEKYLKKSGRYSNIRPMGYNCPFDIKFVQHFLLKENEWNSLLHYKHVDVMQYVDFLKFCKWWPQKLGSLNTVVDFLQLPKRQFHTAKDDCLATIDVLKQILLIMDNKQNNNGEKSVDLISLLESE